MTAAKTIARSRGSRRAPAEPGQTVNRSVSVAWGCLEELPRVVVEGFRIVIASPLKPERG
jgi:hypothetical protein